MRWAEAAGVLLVAAAPVVAGECAPDRVDIRSGGNALRFHVEVVDTAESRAQGLMNRETLPKFSGMLFVYESPQPVAFWMRNTLIPLDMLFFDAEGRLVTIGREARPLDETPVVGGDAIQYVLEINGGLAAELGIEPGAEMRHPAVTGGVWSCSG